jgi:D-glycero-D-manno-heptose 1,7-bisphosphate phosphatase
MKVIKKALFLDRDGVINIDKKYLYKIDDFIFVNGVIDFIHEFYKQNYLIFIITNQSGIVRSFYSEKDFEILSEFVINEFIKRDIKISKIYYCPCLENFQNSSNFIYKKNKNIYIDNCFDEVNIKNNIDCICRKPSPEMILKASRDFDINLKNSILVGDRDIDIEAGNRAGLKKSYLLKNSINIENSYSFRDILKLEEI